MIPISGRTDVLVQWFSDDFIKKNEKVFEKITVGPGEVLIIIKDGKPSDTYLESSVKLAGDGFLAKFREKLKGVNNQVLMADLRPFAARIGIHGYTKDRTEIEGAMNLTVRVSKENMVRLSSLYTRDLLSDEKWKDMRGKVKEVTREDIENGYNAYRWEVVSGGSVVISGKSNEYVQNEGFDAVLTVRSGVEEGLTEIHCITPDTVFVATFNVQDFTNRYPVDEITVDHDPIILPVGGTVLLTTGVIPASSYAYHKPVVKAVDPTKVSVGEYDGNVIPIRALELGETELVLTSNGKEKRVKVTVTEGIQSVLWVSGNARTLFEGQSVQWGIDAKTLSGDENPYDVTWISTNPDVLTAEQSGDDNKHGTITGISAGTSDVTAEVAGVSSEVATVKVIALPVGLNLTASNTEKANSAVYEDGNDLVVIITSTAEYNQIMLTLPDAYKGDYDGVYSIPSGTVVNVDGATAEVVSGSLTVTTTGGETVVSYDISGRVGSRTFSIKATDVPVSL